MQRFIESITEKEKVESLYNAIIRSDPMLYLESLLSQKQIQYVKVKELFNIHPTLLNEYQSQITEIFSRKSVEIDESQINLLNRLSSELNIKLESTLINEFAKNALKNGVRYQTVKEVDEQLPSVRILNKEKEEEENNLADLDEFIEFIDPEMIADSRFLALLRKYRSLDMPLEEYVEYIEEHYNKQIEKRNTESVDKTEDIIR